jgi:hypothetical protein
MHLNVSPGPSPVVQAMASESDSERSPSSVPGKAKIQLRGEKTADSQISFPRDKSIERLNSLGKKPIWVQSNCMDDCAAYCSEEDPVLRVKPGRATLHVEVSCCAGGGTSSWENTSCVKINAVNGIWPEWPGMTYEHPEFRKLARPFWLFGCVKCGQVNPITEEWRKILCDHYQLFCCRRCAAELPPIELKKIHPMEMQQSLGYWQGWQRHNLQPRLKTLAYAAWGRRKREAGSAGNPFCSSGI